MRLGTGLTADRAVALSQRLVRGLAPRGSDRRSAQRTLRALVDDPTYIEVRNGRSTMMAGIGRSDSEETFKREPALLEAVLT